MFITKKHILAFLLCLIIISLPLVMLTGGTPDPSTPDPRGTLRGVGEKAGYKVAINLVDVIGDIIKILLGLLGVIAVIIVIIGGFKWMTAGGSDEKIGAAKKLIGQGAIGLIIVMAAYAIAYFIIDKLQREFLLPKKT